ncbi:hypothetical protein COT82_00935 [Candidatus Campbellbacteria bacterium CG10_big_fil_rev_8_21_14_0_10_35_52]|uniref:Prepilin peptidase n=1 Tax=Candidatus Campbellbacteria bacterium CG10_big_fil_rev_8_21_14_0_10_35_52 TaxID=1974527 RepID=A0A2M6WVY4_9BACT|nr:MAG: hypothetical protein COT82_00935 [Candidatus Campbellbacteria bacterium CG10_big_fil_rev_8_21_14_0_10_35_52]
MESIEIIIAIFYFIFGIIIGSFLNVVSLRYNTGRSIKGRSMCFLCGSKLKWFDLIPIFSFLIFSGRCRLCKSKISWQYIFVELSTGLVFLGIFLKFSFILNHSLSYMIISSVYFMIIFSLLIIIFIYDLKHKIIPNNFVYAFILFSFFTLFFNLNTFQLTTPTISHLAAGPLFFLFFFFLWLISDGRWIGLGDGKLVVGIGWILGLSAGVSAIILSFWIGALFGVGLALISSLYLQRKQFTMKSEIPFGPFLIIGFMTAFFFNMNIFNFIL